MKSTTFKLMTAFLVVTAIISFSFITKSKNDTPKPKYTGHWIAVSGDEYMEVESAEIADDAFQKDSKGKMEHIDENKVARKLNFRNLSKIEGKNVDKHYFLIGQDEPTDDIKMVTPKAKKVWIGCSNDIYPGNYCKAISVCSGLFPYPGWAAYNRCSSGANNFCIGYQIGYPQVQPYMYYVLCTSNL